MASLIFIAVVAAVTGILCGVFAAVCLAIRQEDRKGTLSWDAPNGSAHSARSVVGFGRWS